MLKNKNWLSKFSKFYIVYELRWIIIVCLIVIGIFAFSESKRLDKKYQQYGYSGHMDNIQYDNWTGEIIPKYKIETYSNDDKYIVNLKGEKVSFKQIKDLLEQYRVVQENNAFVKEENLNELTSICDVLLKEYLDLDYKVIKSDNPDMNEYQFKVSGKYEDSYYNEFASISYLDGLVRTVVQERYRNQNNLDS